MPAVAPNVRCPNEADLLGERMGGLPLLAEDRQEDAETNQPTHLGYSAIAI